MCAACCAQLYPACSVELLGMTTRGDQILDRPLSKVGGKGLFVKELEAALLDGSADLAVHSMKDVPMQMEPEFALVAIGPREVPLDAFVSSKYASLDDMPPGAVVGTSSLRREAQLHARYPYLAVTPLRGNLDTRLRKLDEGQFDAIILAAAGADAPRSRPAHPRRAAGEDSLPAAGQGALGIEALVSRPDVAAWVAPLNDPTTAACVRAERAVSRALAGSCEVPLGAYAEMRAGSLFLRGFVASPDGTRMAHAELTGSRRRSGSARPATGRGTAPPGRRRDPRRTRLLSVSPGRPPCRGDAPGRAGGAFCHCVERAGRDSGALPGAGNPRHRRRRAAARRAIRLDSFDLAVFVSPNAIEQALAVILARRPWPAALRVAALGKSSERELARHGIMTSFRRRLRFDSEALLELPELIDAQGKRVIIFRGDGGRELLGDTLKARGASVEYVSCYRRARPQLDPAPLLKLWEEGRLDAVTLTSSEGLRNFFEMVGRLGQAWLSKTPAFVPHLRASPSRRRPSAWPGDSHRPRR
jgi:hydroxymethylbilane synthase